MDSYLTTDELIIAVQNASSAFTLADGRIAENFTERNIRYYVTIGVVRAPVRVANRSRWTQDHVLDLVRVRRAQAAGQSLQEIGPPPIRDVTPFWRAANSMAMRESLISAPDAMGGWSFRISPEITLSGFSYRQPTTQEIQRVQSALISLITDIENDK